MSETTSFNKTVEELKRVLKKKKMEEAEKKAHALKARQEELTQSIMKIMDPYEGVWDDNLCGEVCEQLKMEKDVVEKEIKKLQLRVKKLWKAIEEKDVASVTENIDLACMWVDGYFFFQKAVEVNSVEIVTLFEQHHKIDFGADVEFLNLAIKNGFTEIVEYFLKTYDYTVESEDEIYEYDNPLLKAVETKDEKMVSLLFKYGSIYGEDGVVKGAWHPSFYDNDDDELFLKAVELGVISIVKMLIDAKIDVPVCESYEKLLKVITSQATSRTLLNLIAPFISVLGKRKVKEVADSEKVYKVAKAKRRSCVESYKRDPIRRTMSFQPVPEHVAVYEEVKDEEPCHCCNDNFYVKVVDIYIQIIHRQTGKKVILPVCNDGVVTSVAISDENKLLVGINYSYDDDFEVAHDLQQYQLPFFKGDTLWNHKKWENTRVDPHVLTFGYVGNNAYLCLKDRLVFYYGNAPVMFAFGALEGGKNVIVHETHKDGAEFAIKVFNLKSDGIFVTRTYWVEKEGFEEVFHTKGNSDESQDDEYACVDKNGKFAVKANPYSEKYYIQDLEKKCAVGFTSFAPTFVAKNNEAGEMKDGFVVVNEAGVCYQMISQRGNNYYDTYVRVKGAEDTAAYDNNGKVTCMKMKEDGNLQIFSLGK